MVDIPAGSMITSIRQLSRHSGLTVREVRTALKHLISTQEVTLKTTQKYTLITVEKWWDFQVDELHIDTLIDTLNDKQPTHSRHTTDTQTDTHNKEYKNNNINNNNKNNADSVEKRDQFVFVNKDPSIPYEVALSCENVSREAYGMELL